jgi:hypothetical protein
MSETNWIYWAFVDRKGENPLKEAAVFDCRISFQYTPTTVVTTNTDTTTLNADEISDIIKLTRFDCENVNIADDERKLTPYEKELLNPWVKEIVEQAEKLSFEIKSAALQTMLVN